MEIYVKSCELCGKEFETNLKKKIYCKKPHAMTCFCCGKQFDLKKPRRGQKLYSCGDYKCRSVLTKHVNMEKYGVENTTQLKEVQEKMKKTTLKKYGVEHAFQAEEIKEKINKTNIERYGTKNPRWENEESRVKAEKTNIEKYGSENPFGSDKIKELIKEKNLEKYGVEWTTQAPEVKEKIKSKILLKYGVDNPAKSDIVKEKMKATSLKRYGAVSHMQSEKGLENHNQKIFEKYGVYNISHIGVTNYEDYLDLERFLCETSLSISEIAEYFNLPRRRIRKRIIELELQDLFSDLYVNSLRETELYELLKKDEKLKDLKIIRNDRKILGGKELDFYFPDKKIAVEISPTETHNSKKGFISGEGKSSTYHINKFLSCQKQGIELITIFDWHDWDKVVEMIRIKLQGSSVTKYARKLTYEESDLITPEIFSNISNWHILSLAKNIKRKSVVSLLKDNDEIIGIALWGDLKGDSIELKRMVFKPEHNVPGGASKLINNFLKSRKEIKSVYTFSDCDLGGGLVYGKVGFDLIEQSKPNLSYYNIKHDKHIKHLSLVMQGADRLLKNFPGYIPVGVGEGLPSNREIVESYDFLPIYDCGYRKWLMRV